MSSIGFLYNFAEGTVSRHPFFLYRVAPMSEYLEQQGIQLFVFSPRHVDRETGRVTGFVCKNGRFESATLPVPEVNGNWYIGADKSHVKGGMSGRAFRIWAKEKGVELYPDAAFTDQLRDKALTYKLIAEIDPALHPHTEIFDNDDPDQLERFLQHGEKVFLKPQVGSKGNRIIVVTRIPNGLLVDYYDETQRKSDVFLDRTRARESLRLRTARTEYVIQEGIPLPVHAGAMFILRVIMLHDGERWGWVHKAVLAAPESEIANTTQGGSNHPTEEFLAQVYGADSLDGLMEKVRSICFDTIERLDSEFGNGLMEVGYDLVIDDAQRVYIIEINTRPGMTKPGLPMGRAFQNIFDRTGEENALYARFVSPHGTMLARFLHAKLAAREARRAPPIPGAASGPGAPAPRPAAEAPQSVEEAIRDAAAYLAGACRNDGMFDYRVNLDPAVEVKPRYNVRRHAGAVYSLCQYLEHTGSTDARTAAVRAATFLRDRCLSAIADSPSCYGIWSLAGLESGSRHEFVKLGSVGLGLLAFLGVERHSPGLVPLEQLRGLGHFMLRAQNDDGSFASNYIPARGGFVDRSVSAYYPGEAALALAVLFEHDPDPRWIEASLKGLAYLARVRRDQEKPPIDHWGLVATSRLLGTAGKQPTIASEAELVGHALQVCRSILDGQVLSGEAVLCGGFSPEGFTTPTATALKCLLVTLPVLPDDAAELRERVIAAARRGVDFLLRSQVRSGQFRGGIPRATGPMPGDHPNATRFNRRAGEVRIDYVQHALYALLEFERRTGATAR